MPASVYATSADVAGIWRALTPDEITRADTLAPLASAILRIPLPDLDQRITDDATGDLAIAAKVAVVNAVSRLLANPDGAKRLQETIGDKAYTLDFGDAPKSGLFISDDELGPLQVSAGATQGQALGTAIAQTRLGWSPVDPCANSPYAGYNGWWPVG